MNTFACPSCNVNALGLSFSTFTAGYNVTVLGQTFNAGELFTEEFIGARTESSVISLTKYLNDGTGTVGADGSLTVQSGSSLFKVAPAGSINVSKWQQLKPSLLQVASISKIPGVLQTSSSPAVKVGQILSAGTPGANSAAGTVSTPTAATGGTGIVSDLFSTALSIFNTTQATKQAQANADALKAASSNPPPNASVFGQGAGGTVAPAQPYLPSLPALPPPPPSTIAAPLPISGPVISPSNITSGNISAPALPVFPGLPATSYTGDGSVQLNASSLTQVAANAAAASLPPLPPPSPFYKSPAFIIGAIIAVAGGVFILKRRRKSRR